ncbi:MAG: lasso peptide biosynthesis B2 protein [Burkholderiales bacterium]|nr:lasso peptide biosynthesis B2 protein [Burkholderiales bacterium]
MQSLGCTPSTRQVIMQLSSAQATRYRLADHVRACWVDEQVVLLDLLSNKYLGVGGTQAPALSLSIVDWPVAPRCSTPPDPQAGLDAWLATLLDQRLLVSAFGPTPPRTSIEEPLESLNAHGSTRRQGLEWRHLMRMGWASAVAAHWLKHRSLADIAKNVLRLGQCAQTGGDCTDSDSLRSTMSSYMRLRPFVLTAHDQCLHDSLTLIRFLAMQGMRPHWVIGVRTRPFGAHSWVQTGRLVLNDVHENVRAYTPILVV